jgi:hypothetical protein
MRCSCFLHLVLLTFTAGLPARTTSGASDEFHLPSAPVLVVIQSRSSSPVSSAFAFDTAGPA